MSINRGIDKEDVVHIYNIILLSHKKEQNWVICREVELLCLLVGMINGIAIIEQFGSPSKNY